MRMAENRTVQWLKKLINGVIEKAAVALVIYLVGNVGVVATVILIALRGNTHGPWFYAVAGALAFSVFAILVMTILVIIQLSKKKSTVSVQEIGKSRLAQMQFVYDRAQEQAGRMFRVVSVTSVHITAIGIERTTDPYFDVTVTLWNHSIFDVELEDLAGRFYLNTWEFRKSLHWLPTTQPRVVVADSGGNQFTFRQNLNSEDVNYIRGIRAYFGFGNLELIVKGYGQSQSLVKPQNIEWPNPGPTNEHLVKALGGHWKATA